MLPPPFPCHSKMHSSSTQHKSLGTLLTIMWQQVWQPAVQPRQGRETQLQAWYPWILINTFFSLHIWMKLVLGTHYCCYKRTLISFSHFIFFKTSSSFFFFLGICFMKCMVFPLLLCRHYTNASVLIFLSHREIQGYILFETHRLQHRYSWASTVSRFHSWSRQVLGFLFLKV